MQSPQSLSLAVFIGGYLDRILRLCNLSYHVVHIDCQSAGGTSPPMAAEGVDYDLSLFLEFPCQVRRYQPPLENLLLCIDERIDVFFVDLACTDEFFHHLVLTIKYMQIRYAFCPRFSVHNFNFYIRHRAGALIQVFVCGRYINKHTFEAGLQILDFIHKFGKQL